MNAPLNRAIQRSLQAGTRWSGPHDADLDGVVEPKMDWARLPRFQLLVEAPRVRASGEDRRNLESLVRETRKGTRGAERDLRALLGRIA